MAFSSGDEHGKGGGGSSAISEINVTPLVDVMLVLLIIFMVTTAAQEQEQIEKSKKRIFKEESDKLVELNLPVTPDNPIMADPETDRLVMLINRETFQRPTPELVVLLTQGVGEAANEKARLLVSCADPPDAPPEAWKRCLERVREKLGGTAETANQKMVQDGIYLQADTGIPYGFVAGVMAEVRDLGVDRIDIVTNPSEPEAP